MAAALFDIGKKDTDREDGEMKRQECLSGVPRIFFAAAPVDAVSMNAASAWLLSRLVQRQNEKGLSTSSDNGPKCLLGYACRQR